MPICILTWLVLDIALSMLCTSGDFLCKFIRKLKKKIHQWKHVTFKKRKKRKKRKEKREPHRSVPFSYESENRDHSFISSSYLDNVVLGKASPYGLAMWLLADSQAQPAPLGRQAKKIRAQAGFL